MKTIKKNLLLTLLSITTFFSSSAAAVNCVETITQIIIHSNGNVYFSTDQSCSTGWCMLDNNPDFKKQGYAMLVAAQISGRKVVFNWNDLPACGTAVPTYSVPGYIVLGS